MQAEDQREAELQVVSKENLRISRKSIDGAIRECSLGNLSLNRDRFFENYFVRLIGTPNQHYSKTMQANACIKLMRIFGFVSLSSS